MPGRSDLIIASNRGPLSFREVPDGSLRASRGVGGLVTAVTSALAGAAATWLSITMSDADRRRAADTEPITDAGLPGVTMGLVPVEAEEFERYYEDAANRAIWFAMHGLPSPEIDEAAWGSYRRVNEAVASEILEIAKDGARVLVQDYHLCLVPALLESARPDLRVGVTWHIPFATPGRLHALSHARELIEGLNPSRFVNFHSSRWADRFTAAGASTRARVGPLGVDIAALEEAASRPAIARQAEEIRTWAGGRVLLVRADRVDPAKGVPAGLRAFAAALEELGTSEVCHLIRLTPSRLGVPEYAHELEVIRTLVDDINAGAPDDPIVRLEVEDDRDRTFGAYQAADAFLVSSLADGMNLVAREAPLVNRRDAPLVLSRETGAADELAGAALVVDPADLEQIRDAIIAAMTMGPELKADRAQRLRRLAPGTPPGRWLAAQLDALSELDA